MGGHGRMVDASFISNSAMRPSAVLADMLLLSPRVHPPLPSPSPSLLSSPFSLPLFSPLVSHMSALGAVNISPAGSPATAVAANAVVQPAWWCCVWLRQPGRKSNKFALLGCASVCRERLFIYIFAAHARAKCGATEIPKHGIQTHTSSK